MSENDIGHAMVIDVGRPISDVPRHTVVIGFGGVATTPNTFVVAWGDPPVQVSIHADGKIDLPAGWKPDAAAAEFWKSLGNSVRAMVGLMPFVSEEATKT